MLHLDLPARLGVGSTMDRREQRIIQIPTALVVERGPGADADDGERRDNDACPAKCNPTRDRLSHRGRSSRT